MTLYRKKRPTEEDKVTQFLSLSDIPRHTPPQLIWVNLVSRQITHERTRFHTLQAAAAQDITDGGRITLVINNAPFTFTETMAEGWYLVGSVDEGTRSKVFYLLPGPTFDLDRHGNRIPYLEYSGVTDFDLRYAEVRAKREILLYTAMALAGAIKDNPRPDLFGAV